MHPSRIVPTRPPARESADPVSASDTTNDHGWASPHLGRPADVVGRSGRVRRRSLWSSSTMVGPAVMMLAAGCAQPVVEDEGSRSDVVTLQSATVAAASSAGTAGSMGQSAAALQQSSRRQLSGASGSGAATGGFGTWRGSPIGIGGTWVDTYEAQIHLWSIAPGGEWATWQKDLDIAVGAIFRSRGETWKKAAKGKYDVRWRRSLARMKAYWGDRPGTLHIRFAHEFNGDWTPWYVKGKEVKKFKKAWRRYRTLQRRILPQAKLVFSPNDRSSAALRLDWRKAFPGARYVDEMGVDSYNQYPFVTSAAAFRAKILRSDKYGAPAGIERHRRFARSKGLPLAVPEWSSNAESGDGSVYVTLFSRWLKAHAGTGPGQIPYEILFNVLAFDGGKFALYPRTKMPLAAAAYIRTF